MPWTWITWQYLSICKVHFIIFRTTWHRFNWPVTSTFHLHVSFKIGRHDVAICRTVKITRTRLETSLTAGESRKATKCHCLSACIAVRGRTTAVRSATDSDNSWYNHLWKLDQFLQWRLDRLPHKLTYNMRDIRLSRDARKAISLMSLANTMSCHFTLKIVRQTIRLRISRKPRPHQQQCRSNVRLCCQNGNNVESKQHSRFDFVERIVRLVAFDNAASTLLLVWTGLNNQLPLVLATHVDGV